MEFRLRGPLEVVERDRSLALGGRRQRSLPAVLLAGLEMGATLATRSSASAARLASSFTASIEPASHR
jgi:hypothetical protein